MAGVTEREEIGVREYCDTVYKELTEMKARVFDIICAVEKMPVEERKRFRDRYFEFFDITDYIESKLSTLTKECPLDWKTLREEIESGKQKLTEAINWWDAEHIAGGFVGG